MAFPATETRLDVGTVPGASTSFAPAIAAEGANVYVAWVDDRSGSSFDIHLNRSNDSGASWLVADSVLLDDDPIAHDSIEPRIVAPRSGTAVLPPTRLEAADGPPSPAAFPRTIRGMRLHLALAALLAAVLGGPATSAHAQSLVDGVEHIFGATNVHAITGQGRLSVGVSKDGDVTVLTWPNPSYADQLGYLSSNAIDAREQPRLGAPEGAGLFNGLVIGRGGMREVTWLRDPATWTIRQTYGADDGANPETVHRSDSLGLTVTITDAVAPDGPDVFVRHVRVERDPTSDVASVWLLTYANLSPTPGTSRVPELPVTDWAYDGRNDFAAVWDESADAIVHFHPEDRRIYDNVGLLLGIPSVDWGPAGALLETTPSAAEVATLAAGLDDQYSPGAYLALTTVPPPDQHQIGFDATPFCETTDAIADNVAALPELFPDFEAPIPLEIVDALRCDAEDTDVPAQEGWGHTATDALADAADGELEQSDIAAGEVNEALRTPLTFEGDVAEASVVLGAAATADEARAALASTTAPATVAADAQAALEAWLADRRLPTTLPEEVNRVARRSLINLRVGTVAENGAIVASISRQPPYGLDWPRDGAFFNVALDISGQSELVARRVALYGEWQRKSPVSPTPIVDPPPPNNPDGTRRGTYPAHAWEMNYYSDGMVGGLWRFEIDNAAFAIWTTVAHAGWADDPESHLRESWETIRTGTELLVEWRDPETGLHAPAQEDDNPGYTQTLHGAITTFGAIEIASRAARMIGEDELAAAWEDRAAELRDAILEHLYREEEGYFVSRGTAINPGSAPTGASGWLIWPMQLLPYDDRRLVGQLERDLMLVTPAIYLESEGGAYFLKNTVAGAVAVPGLPEDAAGEVRSTVLDMAETIAGHATEGTRHFGEVMVVVEEGGEARADQRVANPHLWEGTLFYLTAMALEDPEALTAYDRVLPDSRVPAPGARSSGGDDGCGCAVPGATPSQRGPWGAMALLGLAVAAGARRRRVPQRSESTAVRVLSRSNRGR